MRSRIERHGLQLSDLWGSRVSIPAARVQFYEDPSAMRDAALVIVAVKSPDTLAAAEDIARHAPPGALVISLQNGVGNDDVLRVALPAHHVVGGVVPFNVRQMDDGRLHRGSTGDLVVEVSPLLAPWLDLFAAARLPLRQREDFAAVQWAKLLFNLNNAVCAMSDTTVREQLKQKSYRRCLALLMEEALSVLRTAGIRPSRLTPVPAHMLPWILRLPDSLYRRLADTFLPMDSAVRSTMWEDLEAGRPTEIEFLNGAVLRLAAEVGRSAPLNGRMVALVRAAEKGGRRSWPGDELYWALIDGSD